jgi:methenyltetrahydrofolate cyclohydrolase
VSDRETANENVASWLRALAATGPNPGGGAAAALMAGMAAALAEMVAAYRAEAHPERAELHERAHRALAAAMREAAPALADQDTQVAAGFAAAAGHRAGEPERVAAGTAAAESSAALGRFGRTLVPVLHDLEREVGRFLLADVGVAAAALATSMRAAALNVCADLDWAGVDVTERGDLLDALAELDATAAELDGIAASVRARLGPPTA